jgi:hypothetical protein
MVKIYPVDSFRLVCREIIASAFLVSIASLALFLRLAARWAKRIHLWWDDYTIIAVWVRQYERERERERERENAWQWLAELLVLTFDRSYFGQCLSYK